MERNLLFLSDRLVPWQYSLLYWFQSHNQEEKVWLWGKNAGFMCLCGCQLSVEGKRRECMHGRLKIASVGSAISSRSGDGYMWLSELALASNEETDKTINGWKTRVNGSVRERPWRVLKKGKVLNLDERWENEGKDAEVMDGGRDREAWVWKR